jgi:hypothetical protein
LGVAYNLNHDFLIPVFGQPLYVITGAFVGTIAGFAFSQNTESRKMLFLISFACIVVGTACTSILPDLLGFEWYKVEKHASPLAITSSLLSRWVIPMFIKKLDQFFDRLLSLISPKGE